MNNLTIYEAFCTRLLNQLLSRFVWNWNENEEVLLIEDDRKSAAWNYIPRSFEDEIEWFLNKIEEDDLLVL